MLPPPSILLVPGWLTSPKSDRHWPAKVPGTNGDKLAGRVLNESLLKCNLLPGRSPVIGGRWGSGTLQLMLGGHRFLLILQLTEMSALYEILKHKLVRLLIKVRFEGILWSL